MVLRLTILVDDRFLDQRRPGATRQEATATQTPRHSALVKQRTDALEEQRSAGDNRRRLQRPAQKAAAAPDRRLGLRRCRAGVASVALRPGRSCLRHARAVRSRRPSRRLGLALARLRKETGNGGLLRSLSGGLGRLFQRTNACLRCGERLVLNQQQLRHEVRRVRLAGDRIGDKRRRVRLLRVALALAKSIKQVGQQLTFLGCHQQILSVFDAS